MSKPRFPILSPSQIDPPHLARLVGSHSPEASRPCQVQRFGDARPQVVDVVRVRAHGQDLPAHLAIPAQYRSSQDRVRPGTVAAQRYSSPGHALIYSSLEYSTDLVLKGDRFKGTIVRRAIPFDQVEMAQYVAQATANRLR